MKDGGDICLFELTFLGFWYLHWNITPRCLWSILPIELKFLMFCQQFPVPIFILEIAVNMKRLWLKALYLLVSACMVSANLCLCDAPFPLQWLTIPYHLLIFLWFDNNFKQVRVKSCGLWSCISQGPRKKKHTLDGSDEEILMDGCKSPRNYH